MFRARALVVVGAVVVFVLLVVSVPVQGQTASTSTVAGTIFDSSGGLVPKAKVGLLNTQTNAENTFTTGSDGQFTFPSVPPGIYNITVVAQGFRKAAIMGIKVEVGKSAAVNVTLEVGQMTEIVEVVASGAAELQTLDASVGNVLDSNLLSHLPTLNRDATSLLLLQPMAIPGFNGPGGSGEGNLAGGSVAGARADQNTFMIDGGDATSNMEGGGGYNTGFVATPRAVIPTPVESLEEFRVATNNSGADFTRSAGAEVQMVTKRGTNTWHGSGYWYHQNDEMNANDWFRNNGFGCTKGAFGCVIPHENPEWRDNRFGGKIGGPIWKNKTFFFLHEEERHFFTQAVFSRLSPTPALRAGIIEVGSCKSVLNAYNLNPIPVMNPGSGCPQGDPFEGKLIQPSGLDSNGDLCNAGTVGCTPLDPRQLGGSPAVLSEWANMPLPNDYSGGDGLRNANFTGPEANISNEHFAVLRLDHKINDKWNFMASYRYSVSQIQPPNIQEDISGTAPGCKLGTVCALAQRPLQPRFLVTGLTGQIKPNLINEFHFDWLRHWWSWNAPGARIPVISSSLSDAPLQIWRESLTDGMVPINVNTQQARQRVWNGQDYTFTDNLNWLKGKHNFQFGGRAQIEHFLHVRDDKVTGGITQPIYYVAKGGFFSNLGGIPVPNDADSSTAFKRAYISYLGMVDSATQVLTRDASLNPNPPFTNIVQKENVDAYEVHFSDTWRVTSSLTISYGLTWGVQMPPFDPTGKTALMVDAATGKLIDSKSYLNNKANAALAGAVYNPTVGYVPIKSTGRKYPYDPDYSNVGPRLAVAWNPSYDSGLFGDVFGNNKTVIRAGYGRVFDRINGVGIVLTPALGIGFGDLSVCRTPAAGGTATPGVAAGTCLGGGNPATNFRIGIDGNHISAPSLPVVNSGIIIPGIFGTLPPANANSIYENSDSRLDPHNKIGSSDQFDLSVQRQLPGGIFLEVGYVGRIARNLFMNIDLNAVPYMFTPKGTKQSFAQAFDAVAGQLQSGVLPAIKNPSNPSQTIPNPAFKPQPALEAMLGGASSPFCSGSTSVWGSGGTGVSGALTCTQAAALFDQQNGNPYWPSHGAGAVWTLLEPSFATGPMTLTNTQVAAIDWNTNKGYSNYHAGFVTVRKSTTRGLTFDANYTFSHSLDNFGLTQENTCAVQDAYDVNRTYGPSLFDRRHTFNLLLTYELPLGKGKSWATEGAADKVFGGWSLSGVYSAASGLPLSVVDLNACATEFGSTSNNGAPIGLLNNTAGSIGTSRHNEPTTGTFGTNSSPGGVPNAFQNPDAVVAQFRYPTFADNRLGGGAVRGLFRWNVDFALAKTTNVTERFSTRFDVQFVNAFNHPMFGANTYYGFNVEPNTDVSSPHTFGVLSKQFNSPRYIQIGLRFDF
jgi:hypothetical protein